MKRFITSLCFVAFLSAGLFSCADSANDVTPNFNTEMDGGGGTSSQDPGGKVKP